MQEQWQGVFENITAASAEIDQTIDCTVEQTIGKVALSFEGFEILDETKGPYETLRNNLKAKIIDQDPAIDAIIEALERDKVRLSNDNRPITNLAFLGPTGVGKSETAKELSRLLGGQLIKIDCSNFSNGHEVASLTGSPAGYEGHAKTPPLLRKNNVEKPGTVILFDEIEKGSKKLNNLMLQIMGDGELRLGDSSLVSFRKAIIILTSNIGARELLNISRGPEQGFGGAKQQVKQSYADETSTREFQKWFPPEFVNRINKQIVFRQLSDNGLGRILDSKLESANQEFEERFGAHIALSQPARDYLIDISSRQSNFGARPLVRALEDNVYSVFGRHASSNDNYDGVRYQVFHRDELPDDKAVSDESPLVFMSKPDSSLAIKKSKTQSQAAVSLAVQPLPYDLARLERDWGVDILDPNDIPVLTPIDTHNEEENVGDGTDDDWNPMLAAKENAKSALSSTALAAAALAMAAQGRISKYLESRNTNK